ncbi:hypothetical protein RI367_005796 [Sorochytrium milnesiophthora]
MEADAFPCDVYCRLRVQRGELQVDSGASFTHGARVASSVKQLLLQHDLPPYVEGVVLDGVKADIERAIARNEVADDDDQRRTNIRRHAERIAQIRESQEALQVEEVHLIHCVRYSRAMADRGSGAQDFATVYKTLIAAPVNGLFDLMMQLEDSYGQVVRQTIQKRDDDLFNIHQTHRKELEKKDRADTAELASQHAAELASCHETWTRELADLYESQKQEYQDFLRLLKREWESLLPDGSSGFNRKSSALDVKQILGVVFDRRSFTGNALRKSASAELLSIHAAATPPARTEADPQVDDVLKQMVANLGEMGFSEPQAEAALIMTDRNFEAAVNLLLENLEQVKMYIGTQAQAKQAKKAHQRPKSLSVRASLPRSKTASFANDLPQWSPLKLLQGKLGDSSRGGGGNNNASLKKFGDWLGTAMDKLPASEAFPVSLGTQLRLSYVLTLSQHSLDSYFTSDGVHYGAQHAAISSGLYGNDVKVTVLPLTSTRWADIVDGSAGNKAFLDACSATTDFHFDRVNQQLQDIASNLPQLENGEPDLQEGHVLFTRHSNLPHTTLCAQIIVGKGHESGDLSLLPAVMQSLRLVAQLRATHKVDLSVPIALLPDSATRTDLSPGMLRRIEAVMRCLRGSLADRRNQSYLTGVDSGSVNLICNVGPHSNIGGKDMPSVRSIVTSFFRTS